MPKGPRTLPSRTSTEQLLSEVLFTTLRIRQAPDAKALITDADKFLAEVRAAVTKEQRLKEGMIEAEVLVSLVDSDLDALVYDLRTVIARKSLVPAGLPLWDRFFPNQSPSEVVARALRSQLPIVSRWVDSLLADPDKDLLALGAPFAKTVDAAQDALGKQDKAVQAIRDFDTIERPALLESAGLVRQRQWVALSALPKTPAWVAAFFRAGRSANAIKPLAPLTVAAAEAEVAKATQRLSDIKAAEQVARDKAEAEAARIRELADTNKKIAELNARAGELLGAEPKPPRKKPSKKRR